MTFVCIYTNQVKIIKGHKKNIKYNLQVDDTEALVLTSIDEFRRPLQNVSPTQSATLAATGLIWTRYCLVIKPINYGLSLCNFSLGVANGVQCFRAYRYHSLQGDLGNE